MLKEFLNTIWIGLRATAPVKVRKVTSSPAVSSSSKETTNSSVGSPSSEVVAEIEMEPLNEAIRSLIASNPDMRDKKDRDPFDFSTKNVGYRMELESALTSAGVKNPIISENYADRRNTSDKVWRHFPYLLEAEGQQITFGVDPKQGIVTPNTMVRTGDEFISKFRSGLL